MGPYRNHMKIIGDILHAAQTESEDGRGVSVTHLIRRANISHVRISRILHMLVSRGLMEQVDYDGSSKYRISMSGSEFLKEYRAFSRFAESFGLDI